MANKQDIFTVHYSGSHGMYYDFNVDAEETDFDAVNLRRQIYVRWFVRRNNSSYSAYNDYGTSWTMNIGGNNYSGSSTWDCRSDGWKQLGTQYVWIPYNANGTKTITISGTHTGNSASGPSKMGNASGSGTYTLTSINIQSAYVNVNGTWKHGRAWVNVNGTWKPGRMWINQNGTWKPGK